MKQLVNGRSLTFFAIGSALLIAVTSFLFGLSDGEIGLLPPVLTVLATGMAALFFEAELQRRAK